MLDMHTVKEMTSLEWEMYCLLVRLKIQIERNCLSRESEVYQELVALLARQQEGPSDYKPPVSSMPPGEEK